MSQIPVSPPNYTPPSASGFDVTQWINIWTKALTKPSVATYEELERHPQVTMINALIWSAISGAIGGFLGGLIGIFTQHGRILTIFTGAIGGAIGSVIGLLIYALIVFAICKAQGGTGTFETQVALLGTIIPPLVLVSLFLAQIPILGAIISIVLLIYQMYLYIVATQAAQNVTMGKAAIAVLLPGLLVLCCMIVFAFGILAALGIGSISNSLP
jgi:hypothetical protein